MNDQHLQRIPRQ